MDKKYELIKDSYWYRVKALKDFTLITGEQIKKSDVGGCVDSEDCLSQEGLCWVKDEAYVFGKVSGNAVVKDFAEIYGCVTGNAIVKDFTFVGENATVTGNAVGRARQCIIHGTVTTDLLGTKDWASALYAELGVVPNDGKVLLYHRVWSTDNPKIFVSDYNRDFIYEIGKEAVETDVTEDALSDYGKGFLFTSLKFIGPWEGNAILECEVAVKDILTVQFSKVRARKCKVIRVYKEG